MSERFPQPTSDAPLVVFDFDHTLCDGDAGTGFYRWLIGRAWWRRLLALLVAPVAGPMVAFLATRKRGISAFVWAGSVGDAASLDALIDSYVAAHEAPLHATALPIALDVFAAHRRTGDRVVVATGAPPRLARAILRLVADDDLPVIGTELGPGLGGFVVRQHCHFETKMTMLRAAGFTQPVARAYSDSSADLPLLQAAAQPVVVNPKPSRVALFRRVLPAGTPILHWGSPGRAGEAPGLHRAA